jgi:hypothetical protein
MQLRCVPIIATALANPTRYPIPFIECDVRLTSKTIDYIVNKYTTLRSPEQLNTAIGRAGATELLESPLANGGIT